MPNNILDEHISRESKRVVSFDQLKIWLLVLFLVGTTLGLALSFFYLKPMLIEANADANQTVQNQAFFFRALIDLTYLTFFVMIVYLGLVYYAKLPNTGFSSSPETIGTILLSFLLLLGCSVSLGLFIIIAFMWLPQWFLTLLLPEVVLCIISSLYFFILYKMCKSHFEKKLVI